MTRHRRILAALAVSAAVLVAAPPAWAYWTVSSTSASGSSRVDALGTPTVTATRLLVLVLYTATFRVDFVPPGLAPTGYRVTLASGGGTLCTITGTTGSCPVVGLGGSDQVFNIVAYRGSGTSAWTSLTAATCTFSGGNTADLWVGRIEFPVLRHGLFREVDGRRERGHR